LFSGFSWTLEKICAVGCDAFNSDVAFEKEGGSLALPEGVPVLRAFYLYLTTGCNLACRHCWIVPKSLNGEAFPGNCLDVVLLREAVAEAKPLGLAHAKLTGGEPTLHPRFLQIVDLLTGEGLRLSLETNGTLIDRALARHLKENTSLDSVSISLDGATAETHDAFRNVPGAFGSALGGLDHLVDAGYKPQVIMSPHRGNIGELEDLVKLAVERGAGSVKFNPVMRVGRGIAMHKQDETLNFDEVIALARFVRGELQDRTPIRLVLMTPPALFTVKELIRSQDGADACGVRHILGILGSGEMALCGIGRSIPDLCFGQLGRDSVRKVWLEHPKLKQLRHDLESDYPGVCGQCIHAPRCLTHCVAQNYADSGNLVWPSWLCAEAEARGVFPKARWRSWNGDDCA
jgi:SynChlorMet cassette radical SAM/SPASM protein ScmF